VFSSSECLSINTDQGISGLRPAKDGRQLMAKTYKNSQDDKDNKKDGSLKEVLALSSIGMSFVLCILIGLAMGYYIDKYFSTRPWFTVLFLGFGIAAGFKNLYDAVKRYGYKDN